MLDDTEIYEICPECAAGQAGERHEHRLTRSTTHALLCTVKPPALAEGIRRTVDGY